MKTGSPEYDGPHRLYSFVNLNYVWEVYPSKAEALREARRMSREYCLRLHGYMHNPEDTEWYNGFAAAFYRVEPVEDAS